MTVIETERLFVRNFRETDWRDLRGYISKSEVIRFEPGWDPSEDSCRDRVKEFARGNGFWAVELKSARKMIGHIIFDSVPPKNLKTWMIGYIFDSNFYGRGYATEACKSLISYGFNDLKIHRVMAKCRPILFCIIFSSPSKAPPQIYTLKYNVSDIIGV